MALSETLAQPAPGGDMVVETAPVKIDRTVLFQVRGLSAYTAEERASAIAGRITALAVVSGSCEAW